MGCNKSMIKNWKSNFLKIWAGQTVSILSSSILQFAIVWYLTDRTNSPLVLSIAMLFGFLPRAVLGPFIGAFIDRYDRKKIMIFADLFIAAVSLILVFAGISGEPLHLWIIYMVLFFRSLGSAFHDPTLQAVTPQMVPPEELVRSSGYSQALESVSMILSPALAAVLYSVWSLNAIIMLDVFGAIIAVITIMMSEVPSYADQVPTERSCVFTEVKEGFIILKSNNGLMGLVLVTMLYSLALMPISALFPLMSMSYFGGTSTHAGLVEVIFAIGLLIGSITLSVTGGTKNRMNSIIISYVMMTISLIVSGMLSKNQFSIFVVCSFFMGVSGPLFWGMYRSLLQQGYEQKYLGRVMALSNSITVIASPIGMTISGLFSEFFGAEKWFLVAGTMTAVATLICLFVPAIRNCGNVGEVGKTNERMPL